MKGGNPRPSNCQLVITLFFNFVRGFESPYVHCTQPYGFVGQQQKLLGDEPATASINLCWCRAGTASYQHGKLTKGGNPRPTKNHTGVKYSDFNFVCGFESPPETHFAQSSGLTCSTSCTALSLIDGRETRPRLYAPTSSSFISPYGVLRSVLRLRLSALTGLVYARYHGFVC